MAIRLGLKVAVNEYARNLAGKAGAGQGAISEINLPAQARFAYKLYRSGHRCVAYPLVLFPDQIIQFLDGHMLFDSKEHIQNMIPLSGASEALVSYKLCELLFGVHYFYPCTSIL